MVSVLEWQRWSLVAESVGPAQPCHGAHLHFQPAQPMDCKLETSDYEGVCLVIIFLCMLYLLWVESTFLCILL